MILHTKLTIPECIERLTQPFLSDPDATDTENIIKRPLLPQTGLEYSGEYTPSSKWVILIRSRGNKFEIVKRVCRRLPSGEFCSLKESGCSDSVSCSMVESKSGGTDIECMCGESQQPSIIKASIAFAMIWLLVTLIEQIHMSYDVKTLLQIFIAVFVGVDIFYIVKIFPINERSRLVDFAADLLGVWE